MTGRSRPVLHPRGGTSQRVVCPTCGVGYRPALTRWACPVCDTDAPGAQPVAAAERAWQDPDTRVIAIVIAATAVNLIVLAVLTIVAIKS